MACAPSPARTWRFVPVLAVLLGLSAVTLAAGSRRPIPPAIAPLLAPAGDAAAQMPRLRSLLVSRSGELVLERYYRGASAARLANVKSVSKSIVSALVGLAIDQDLIAGVHVPIATYFPSLANDPDPRKREITIEDLLTMRSALESTSSRNYGAWVQSRNWVQYALSRPLIGAPGLTMEYSTGNTHLLSAILTKATKGSTWQFAREHLAKPLGFTLARWPQDPQGIYFGGNEMLLTPRQMVTFGELYLNRGRVDGRQLLPEEWIDASFVPRGRSRWSGRSYGYGWWIRDLAGQRTYYAWGYGGQFIFVVPALDLVVVTTSSVSGGPERRGHLGDVYDLVGDLIVAPITSWLTENGASQP